MMNKLLKCILFFILGFLIYFIYKNKLLNINEGFSEKSKAASSIFIRLFGSKNIDSTKPLNLSSPKTGCNSIYNNLCEGPEYANKLHEESDLFTICNNVDSEDYTSIYLDNLCTKELCCDSLKCNNGKVTNNDCNGRQNEDGISGLSFLIPNKICGDNIEDCTLDRCCTDIPEIRVIELFNGILSFADITDSNRISGKTIRNFIYYIMVDFSNVSPEGIHFTSPQSIVVDGPNNFTTEYSEDFYDNYQTALNDLNYTDEDDLEKIILKPVIETTFTESNLRDHWIGSGRQSHNYDSVWTRLSNTLRFLEGSSSVDITPHVIKKFIIMLNRCDSSDFFRGINPLDSLMRTSACNGIYATINLPELERLL